MGLGLDRGRNPFWAGGALITVLAAGCSQAPTPQIDDASTATDASSKACSSDDGCDDGAFCNGAERCSAATGDAGSRACMPGTPPCTGACDEATDACTTEECDADHDGVRSAACGGPDCDDTDPNRSPASTEVCDGADRDEDCDPATFGVRDADHDDEPDAACCNTEGGVSHCGTDCDDTRAGVGPNATETCNLRDDDCDAATDEGVLVVYYADLDGDGFGDPSGATTSGCSQPPMFSDMPTDCDDAHASAHPGGVEVCDADGVDEDCDGAANPSTLCSCTGTAMRSCPLPGACAGSNQQCMGGAWGPCSVPPGPESCNGADDDCDGTTDEGTLRTCFADADEDGYAEAGAAVTMVCACPIGTTARDPVGTAIDCREGDMSSHPGASERCDRIDNDCSTGGGSEIAEDADGDGHAPATAACSGGMSRDDCMDLNRDVRPDAPPGFPSTFACPSDYPVPCVTYFSGVVEWCQRAGTTCEPFPPSDRVVGSWDYDCKGVLTREAAGGSSCSASGVCSGIPGECGDGGFDVSPTAPCGTLGNEHVCGCRVSPPGCFTISSVSRGLRCR